MATTTGSTTTSEASVSSTKFCWPVRIYYEDTDHGGVVYYANYLKFMERARTEWLRSHGIEQDALIKDAGLIFAVRSAELDFIKPARFNQQLAVSVAIIQAGKVSITFEQEVRLMDMAQDLQLQLQQNAQQGLQQYLQQYLQQQGEAGIEKAGYDVLCRGRIRIASLDAHSLTPKAIPAPIRKEIFGDN